MKTLPGFWHAAARMSGRINFGSLFDSKLAGHPIEERSISQLIDGGIRAQDARILRNTAPLDINVQWLTIGDEDYPSSLKHVPHAPPVLFYEGNIQRLNAPALAVVGARRCSVPGEAWAMTLSRRCTSGCCDCEWIGARHRQCGSSCSRGSNDCGPRSWHERANESNPIRKLSGYYASRRPVGQ